MATLVHILNECWNQMPLEKRTEKGSELIAGLGLAGIGKKWDELARSGKLVDTLDERAEPLMNQSAEVKAKATQAIKKFVNEVILDQQPAVTPDGHVLMMKGDKGLPQGVKPSEKLQPKRSFNEKGEQLSIIEVPDEVMKIAELHGFDRAVIQRNLQKLSDAVHETFVEIGEYIRQSMVRKDNMGRRSTRCSENPSGTTTSYILN